MRFATSILPIFAAAVFGSAVTIAVDRIWPPLRASGLQVATGAPIRFGDVDLRTVNNRALVVGPNQVIQFSGQNGGFRFGPDGVAAYNEATPTALTFQTSRRDAITEIVIQPNGQPHEVPSAWALVSLNFQAGPNEERWNFAALNGERGKAYAMFQVIQKDGKYYPVDFYGKGRTLAFRINAETDSSIDFKTPVRLAGGATLSKSKFEVMKFGDLPSCPDNEGTLVPISDSKNDGQGEEISGGGGLHVLAYCNGTRWAVVAK